jgi:formate dehydrogenase subunit gamma
MRRRAAASLLVALALAALVTPRAEAAAPLPFPPLTFGPHELERCLRCHGIPNFLYRDSLAAGPRDLTVDTRAHVESVHGALECTQCHPDVRAYPHEFTGGHRRRVSCDDDCHATDIAGRPVSHRQQVADVAGSAHRGGPDGSRPDSPACVTCHGAGRPHAIASPTRTLGARERLRLCAECHEDRPRMARHQVDAEAVPSYRRSFHYRALLLGADSTAVCQDCHTPHRVLSPDSLAASVNRAHVVETCGRKGCHPGALPPFAMSGANHLGMRARREPALRFEERALVVVALVVALALLADMALDAWRRRRARRARGTRPAGADAPPPALVARLTLAQRLQHGALALAFVTLALTGLPLRFPETPALAAVIPALGGLGVARALHRGAAVTLMLTGLAHLVYALVALARARLRPGVAWTVLPGRHDLGEARDLAAFLAGRRALPPASGRFDTRNKLHYLAVAWGLPVMALSGLVLWFPVALGGRLPELAIGLATIAHRDEALLAIGVVLVWHLYVVHVAPGRHHRWWTALDGRVTRAHLALRHPREAAAAGTPVSDDERRALLEDA